MQLAHTFMVWCGMSDGLLWGAHCCWLHVLLPQNVGGVGCCMIKLACRSWVPLRLCCSPQSSALLATPYYI